MDWKTPAFVGLAVVAAIVVFLHSPIPQPESYHHFADARRFLAIPNTLNVLSNLGFLIVGVWGTLIVLRDVDRAERLPYLFLFVGVLLTAFGSAYYHWSPSDARLVWDRLPMTFGFMGLFAAIIGERMGLAWQRYLLWPLVAIGVFSVLYWYWTESQGHGDLRLYVLVQFYPLIGILFLMAFFPARYNKGGWLIVVMVLYALAKVFESFDGQVFSAIGIGGHALKHLAASAATAVLAWMLLTRSSNIYSGSAAGTAGV